MLKVKKTTYESIPKNNELTKLATAIQFINLLIQIKQAIHKIEGEKNKKDKIINDYAKLIQSIKKEYQRLVLENEVLKKKVKNLEDKQFTTDLINHNRKQQEFFEGKRKRHYKKQVTYSESSSGDTESEYYEPKKRKAKIKTTKNVKDIMIMMMMMI